MSSFGYIMQTRSAKFGQKRLCMSGILVYNHRELFGVGMAAPKERITALEICGIPVSCAIAGQGPPLLFLHGWGVGHDSYGPLLRQLEGSHTVYAPDLPGFGGTPEPESPWRVEDYVEFVRQFISLNKIDRPVIVGHSNGGRVALHYAARGGEADRLVLFGPAGVRARRGARYYGKVYLYKAGKILLSPFPKLKEAFRRGKGSADYQNASPVMRATMSNLLGTDVLKLLPSVKTPVLLIWGRADTASPFADAARMEAALPDAGLVAIEGGHWSFMQQLDYVRRILDSFLGGVGR